MYGIYTEFHSGDKYNKHEKYILLNFFFICDKSLNFLNNKILKYFLYILVMMHSLCMGGIWNTFLLKDGVHGYFICDTESQNILDNLFSDFFQKTR